MKIIRMIVIILAILVGVNSTEYTANAQEVVTKEQAAEFLKKSGMLQGDNGNLMLDKTLTREEMMVIVSRFLGVEDEALNYTTENMSFKDIPKDSWAAPYIAWAQENQITEGYSSEQFGFKDSLTVWQTQAFLVRTLGYYPSDEEIESVAKDLGIINNIELASKSPILRKDMAVLMYNTLSCKTERGQIIGEVLGILNTQTVSDEVLRQVVLNSMNSAQSENIESYLETMYVEPYMTASVTDFLTAIFEAYDLKYSIESFKVLEKDNAFGIVEVTQITKKVAGPEFADNKEVVQYYIEKFDDKWKITETELLSYEVLTS